MQVLGQDAIEALARAAASAKPVKGLTHSYYRYPARFSPEFARTAIQLFTKPGDLVLDPFMGGGTTLVESFAAGRRAIGTDISGLAAFVTNVKTNLLTRTDVDELRQWFDALSGSLSMRRPAGRLPYPQPEVYTTNINDLETWTIRKAIGIALARLRRLRNSRQRGFARCVLLRTAQWALDGRKDIPGVGEFRAAMRQNVAEMLDSAWHYVTHVRRAWRESGLRLSQPVCRCLAAAGLPSDSALNRLFPPKLILTSPPYPGVHVLYDRWQVQGRRETPVPFLIAGCLDGHGESYYTMGSRTEERSKTYYTKLLDSMRALRDVSGEDTVLVQMVAFPQPEWQLPEYLSRMQQAGWREKRLSGTTGDSNERLWRSVPNRKWHATLHGRTPGSQEVVLIHTPA